MLFMSTCQRPHRNDPFFSLLPKDQGDFGRHKCAGCAYEKGFELGSRKILNIDLQYEIESIQDSQAQEVRHKSPYLAFALGYSEGLEQYYDEHPEVG